MFRKFIYNYSIKRTSVRIFHEQKFIYVRHLGVLNVKKTVVVNDMPAGLVIVTDDLVLIGPEKNGDDE